MSKPVLSIGIIFKNEIRCLERCLKSLQPLRDAMPCELVMADTGADDGSREVAGQYADILFDFPWIDDFAAARNAVMDRCSGEWYMTIDCDEWVDSDVQGFVRFLTTNQEFDFASVIIRNYDTAQLDSGGAYSDFVAVRILRMSTGVRYEGAIHEHLGTVGDVHTMMISKGLFHHDGYVPYNAEMRRKKQKRNMALLHKQLEETPNNLVVLTQCVESASDLPEQEDHLRRALVGVDEKWEFWELFGPPLYRHAVRMAIRDGLPELEEWIHKAETMFPDSIFVRVEIAYFAFGHAWNTDHYSEAVRWGERYLQGVSDYNAGRFHYADLLASSVNKTDIHNYLNVATVLASGYLYENKPQQCAQLLAQLDPCEMNDKQISDCVNSFCRLHGEFSMDTDSQLLRFWDRLREPLPDQAQAERRERAFIQEGAKWFQKERRKADETAPAAYTAFLPLEGKCGLGDAAAIFEAADPRILEEKLGHVERWDETPIQALFHALACGARFPLPVQPLYMEQLERLASRLVQIDEDVMPLLLGIVNDVDMADWQGLVWAQRLTAAAVQSCLWKSEELDAGKGLAIARSFAKIEKHFLPQYFAADILREGKLFTLPLLHRVGWYLIQAFEVLDAGDTVGYVQLLRKGLTVCEEAKDMVAFLLEHTPELQTPPPSAELLALAEQIRTVLANFAPDDPTVAALKQSEAYQKVAHLIEGLEPPVIGGLLQ